MADGPIDLHEVAPGHWEARPGRDEMDGVVMERPRPRRRRPPEPDAGLGFVLMFVVIVAVSSILRLFGVIS